MRMLNSSLAAASFFGFIMAAGCTLIADVDRTKIPTDTGPQAGETGTGGSTGGTGQGGKGGTGGMGQAGMAGGGEEAGTGGTNAGSGGGENGGSGGTGGTGTPTEQCDHAKGTLTIGEGTLIADGDTLTLGDGINNPVVFEFDLDDAFDSTHVQIKFNAALNSDGTQDEAELATIVTAEINGVTSALAVTARTTAEPLPDNGASGAGGESGASSNAGATSGGQGGAGSVSHSTETVTLENDLAGARGNVKLKDTVGNPNFKTSGMSGGNSVVCSQDSSCSGDGECDSDRTCNSDHVCE